LSPACDHHAELECAADGTVALYSRDFDGSDLSFCMPCAADAVAEGMFGRW
jgi:hypothetical protein